MRVLLFLVALAFASAAHAGDCSDAAFSGGSCVDSSRVAQDIGSSTYDLQSFLDDGPTFDAPVIATGFDTEPDDSDGGDITLKGCDGGSPCYEDGEHKSLTIKLPDDAMALLADKTQVGIRILKFMVWDGDASGDAGNCMTTSDAGVFATCGCNGTAWRTANVYLTEGLFTSSVYIHDCKVAIAANGYDQTGDQHTLKVGVVDYDESACAEHEMTDDFIIKQNTQSCGSDTNCIGDGGEGVYTWQVRERYDFVNDGGSVFIQLDAVTDGGSPEGVYMLIECEAI